MNDDSETVAPNLEQKDSSVSRGRHHSAIKFVGWSLGGAFGGIITVLLVGYLSLRAKATSNGGVLDLYNNVVAVIPPSIPLWSFLSLAVLGWLVLYVVVRMTTWASAHRLAGSAAFSVTMILLVVWGLMHYPLPSATYTQSDSLFDALSDWLNEGASLSMVQVLAPLPVVAGVYARRRVRHER